MRRTILTLLLVLVAPAMLSAQTATGAEAEVRATIDRLFDAMRAGDGDGVRAVFHPRARLMTTAMQDGAPLVREDAVEQFAAAVAAPRDVVWDERLHDVVIHVDGNLASAWTPYRFYAGERFSHCGVNAIQLVRDDNGWKILQLVDTRRREGC
jgi:ketosteroid isomerase-like protein